MMHSPFSASSKKPSPIRFFSKKNNFFKTFFKKGLDIFKKRCIIYLLRGTKRNSREWRNWQTRTFEGRVVHTVRVQVPFPAPKRADRHLPIGSFSYEIGS